VKFKKLIRKNKKKILIGSLIILGLIVMAYFITKPFSVAGRSCNLGSWHVSSYDSAKNEIKIDGSIGNYNSAGCIGTYDVTSWDRGGLNINNQEFCNSFFGTGSYNDELSVCILINENWFNDKEIKSLYGTCTMTCTDSRGCGGVGLGAGQSIQMVYSAGFDGFILTLPTPYNSWTPISCSGGFVVGLKNAMQNYYRLQNNACTLIQLTSSQATSNDYLTMTECQSHITIGSRTYFRFQNNACTSIQLTPSQKTNNDYPTLQECQENVIQGTSSGILIPMLIITGSILFVFLLIFIYVKTRRRR